MKKQTLVRILCALLVCLLTAFLLVSCADVEKTGAWETATYTKNETLGKGAKTITVKVIAEEQELIFTIKTDKENLEDALLEHELIAGDESSFGLYIKKVNGIVADYDTDKSYWAITKNGEATSGAKSTVISDGECYELTKTISEW